ncbi:hypothetical protein Tco_0118865, partial [Tanacetum coccineum]
MASADNTSGPAPQRKERCTIQCTLSLKEEKSSYLRAVLSTTSISSNARSVNKWINVPYMAPVQSNPGPAPNLLTLGPISSGLVPNPAPAIPYVPPTNKELEMLFQPMFDEYFNPPGIRQDPIPNVAQDPVIPTGEQYAEVNSFAAADPEPFVNVFAPDPTSEASSSGEIMMQALNQSTQPHEHI